MDPSEKTDFVVYNPLVETLVHPASEVGEGSAPSFVTKLALRLRGLGRRKRTKLHVFQPQIPPELWLIIFDVVLAPIRRTHELANSETIPTTTRTVVRFGMHIVKYDDWPRLRLVCRMFHALLGPNRYQGIRGETDDRSLPPGVEALSMITEEGSLTSFVALQDLSTLSTIRLLDITLIDGNPSGRTIQDIMDYLYAVSPNLPSLRSLSAYCCAEDRHRGLRGDTWQKIAESFPLLEDLCIWANEPIGAAIPATFEKVKALRMHDMPATNLIHFPSLLYVCAFRWNPEGAFEKLHAPNLISLGASHPHIGLDSKILYSLPNARHLGAPISSLAELESPPPGHPINHFSVVVEDGESIRPILEREMPGLVRKLREIPGINKLSFGRDDGLPPAEMKYVVRALRNTNVVSVFAEP